MILIGILLVVVGAAVLYFFRDERFAAFGGAVLILLGVLAVIVGLADHADIETAMRSSWG